MRGLDLGAELDDEYEYSTLLLLFRRSWERVTTSLLVQKTTTTHYNMSDYICWLCDRKEDRKSDLKHHLTSIHDRLKLVWAWCERRELTFRKAVDLKLHVKTNHKIIFREAPSDCFGEPNSFWFSKYPKDYIRIIKPTRRDSVEARFSRRAIEKWWPSVGNTGLRNH